MLRPDAFLLAAALLAPALGVAACRGDAHSPATPGGARGAAQVTIGAVRWFVDYDAALAVAREQDKALWVHFGENPG